MTNSQPKDLVEENDAAAPMLEFGGLGSTRLEVLLVIVPVIPIPVHAYRGGARHTPTKLQMQSTVRKRMATK
jgi:hypothetical protein